MRQICQLIQHLCFLSDIDLGGNYMKILKKILFYLFWMIKKIMVFLIVPSKNYSMRNFQLIILVILVREFAVFLKTPNVEFLSFLLRNIIIFSMINWFATLVLYVISRKDPIFMKSKEISPFTHENSNVNNIIFQIENLKKSLEKWAGDDEEKALKNLKLLRILDKVNADKKRYNFFINSTITFTLGLTATIIFNKDVMKVLNSKIGSTSIDENLIYYTNGFTLSLIGIMLASKFLILGHNINRINELYEEVLNNLILEIEEKKVDTENTSISNN
ncbi:hypothetical protein ABQG68_03670 [Bacillus pumilus]|uniref:hypothetical protein n=1 Tax=Bacillus pumilus TaxID=1408 RepID=UPI003316390C